MTVNPALGQSAPDFTAPVVGGSYSADSTVTLSALRGRPVVLYFYPKDDTPGCTTQACALRDGWDTIKEKAMVFGVSTDSVASHVKFQTKYSLPFPLISDADRAIAEAYGVWVEKSMYGKKYMGMERSTFVIGADGKITTVLEKVAPAKHLELLEEALG
ncbi:MAG: peroxiredoxin [Verrucomicrobiales bacterium]